MIAVRSDGGTTICSATICTKNVFSRTGCFFCQKPTSLHDELGMLQRYRFAKDLQKHSSIQFICPTNLSVVLSFLSFEPTIFLRTESAWALLLVFVTEGQQQPVKIYSMTIVG